MFRQRQRNTVRLLALLTITALAGSSHADPAQPSPDALWQKIQNTRLEPERAVAVRGMVLDTGMARFIIDRGTFFPATAVGERSVEMVFQGDARLSSSPPTTSRPRSWTCSPTARRSTSG